MRDQLSPGGRPPAPRRTRETFTPAVPGSNPGALIPGEGDTPPPVGVCRTTRRGLWCDTCRAHTRIELDITTGDEVVATLQGCPRCRSGLCQAR